MIHLGPAMPSIAFLHNSRRHGPLVAGRHTHTYKDRYLLLIFKCFSLFDVIGQLCITSLKYTIKSAYKLCTSN